MLLLLLTVLSLLVTSESAIGPRLCSQKCKTEDCLPSTPEWTALAESLEGQAYLKSSQTYKEINTMKNGRVKKHPAAIVLVKSELDIVKCIQFAKTYNLSLSVYSSGHSMIGRSTQDGSLQINLSNMTRIDLKIPGSGRSPAGEITVQSGCPWAKVYKELDKHGRIVVGGSAHTVSMGGYTQGGGHSPMSRSLGLAVDNLLEARMVKADGSIVTVSNTSNPELFWALRGGGGGTWGVVTSFTFKLHIPPPQFVHFFAIYALRHLDTNIGRDTLKDIIEGAKDLTREWGGYVILSSIPTEVPGYFGSITLSMLHYGPLTAESWAPMHELLEAYPPAYVTVSNKTTFWDYSQNNTDPDMSMLKYNTVNTFVQPSVDASAFTDVVLEEMFKRNDIGATGCTGTLLGGQVSEVPKKGTPVHPGFRSALFSWSCGRVWDPNVPEIDAPNNRLAEEFQKAIQKHGKGVYFNEPPGVLQSWKQDFWAYNYDPLLGIKLKVDPHNVFCCDYCVGSDIDAHGNVVPSSARTLRASFVFVVIALFVVL